MPTYGAAKKRDMARSILPSTKKNGQDDRRRVHKRARTHERGLMGCAWDDDDADFDTVEHTRARETRNLVEERRFKDKAGPFARWAERVTKDLPQENRLSYLRSLVPDTLIGEHAVSHVEWKDHFEDPTVQAVRESRYANNSKHYRKAAEREEMVALVRAVLVECDGHARLNRAVKSRHLPTRIVYEDGRRETVGPTSARTLKGVHDVEAFVDALYAAASRSDMVFSRAALDTRYHARVQYGKDAGAFWVPTGAHHPEWLDALRAFFAHSR